VENEYYSPIRPKQPTRRGEKPVLALERRGLQYLEVRLLDVDPYHPLGISPEKAAFVEVFLLACMLWDSPYFLGEECRKGARHRMEIARSGRDPSLRLPMDESQVTVREGLEQLWPVLEAAADCMDQAHGSTNYRSAVDQQAAVVADPQLLPSSRLLRELREGSDHVTRMLELSHEHRTALSDALDSETVSSMQELARRSHREQADLEASDDISFEEYLRRYYEG
jgi:glutamate--cysteine ligase